MSYHGSPDDAVLNAGRFLTEGMADSVKLEVNETFEELVWRMAEAGIPVVAHLGSRPQQVRREGGYHSAGRTKEEAEKIVHESRVMEQCGAVMILLEAVPAQVTDAVIDAVQIPVIGCGAGPRCNGHVVVLHDLLKMTDWQPPFVRSTGEVGSAIEKAARDWSALLQSGEYLKTDHPYKMKE
jgi:3-methyl-2-oxobutanoate hydroxymethyltransferase